MSNVLDLQKLVVEVKQEDTLVSQAYPGTSHTLAF